MYVQRLYGARIKLARQSRALTIGDLARHLNTVKRRIVLIEDFKFAPTFKEYELIKSILDYPDAFFRVPPTTNDITFCSLEIHEKVILDTIANA